MKDFKDERELRRYINKQHIIRLHPDGDTTRSELVGFGTFKDTVGPRTWESVVNRILGIDDDRLVIKLRRGIAFTILWR